MIGTLQMHASAKEVAEEIRAARQRAGLSQVALATLLGVSRRSVGRWESGRGHLHKVYLQRIRALGQTPREGKEVADAQQQVPSREAL